MKKGFWIRKAAGFILLGVLAVLFFSFIVMTLWNNILVAVLHVGVISFAQAIGILVLSKILFSGFRGGSWGGRHDQGRHSMWKNEMRAKWEQMNPEEREQMKQQWKERCSGWKRNAQEQRKAGT